MTGVMTITGLSQLSSRNPPRLEAVNSCPSNPVFNPLAIELKLYRRLRADETHTLTKFDAYPIDTRGVRTMRGQVGPTESSVVDTCHPNFFFNLKAIELKLYRDVRADEPQFLTKFDHYPIIRTEVRKSSVPAFDCISNKLLIAKFRSYGLSMSACHLLTSYLRDRTQRVKLGNTKSKWLHINKGSAQGSILGPFCYNVFTNDMLSIVSDNIEIYNYADDNTVICSGYEYEDIKAELMLNVDKIIDWFRDNHMKVNPDKFQCIVFGNVVNPGTFIINGNIVRPEETVKLLGVHIDNKLDFGHHVSHICQKAGKQVKVLSRLSRVLNESNKLLLYSSFISCYFNYCCVFWHFCNNSDTLKIEKLQEKALRYSMLDFKSPYQQLLHNCGKSTLFLQRLQKLMEVIYRILNGLYPSYLNDIITVEELQHLRCRSRLFIPPFSTVRYGKKSLSYLSPVLWNSLGNDIKQCDVLTAFKKRIKLWKGPTCNCGFCAQCRISNR